MSMNYGDLQLVDFGCGLRLPRDFNDVKGKIEHLEVRDDDVWVTSYPKSGSTWCQELVWLIANDLDYEGVKDKLVNRFSFIDGNSMAGAELQFAKNHKMGLEYSGCLPDFVEITKSITSRRFIKCHLPWDFLPKQIVDGTKNPKVVRIIRDPKQVAVSFYHHATSIIPSCHSTMEDFIQRFMEGRILYGDYFRHLSSYWEHRELPNLLIVSYEEMSSDLPKVIKRVADFFGKSYNEEEITKLGDYLSFENMRANRAVNMREYIAKEDMDFMRKGTVDSYKFELTAELIAKLDDWIEKNVKGTGLPYDKE